MKRGTLTFPQGVSLYFFFGLICGQSSSGLTVANIKARRFTSRIKLDTVPVENQLEASFLRLLAVTLHLCVWQDAKYTQIFSSHEFRGRHSKHRQNLSSLIK